MIMSHKIWNNLQIKIKYDIIMSIAMTKLQNKIRIEGNTTFNFSFDNEANSWYVFCPEFRLQAFGATREEAETNIKEVIVFTIDDLIVDGDIEEYINNIGGKIIDNDRNEYAIKVIANKKEYIFLPESTQYTTTTTRHLEFDLA
jgi:predicted RNase H-like HicB family nuclease